MAAYFATNAQAIGGTPLVKINRIIGNVQANVLAKIEGRNPAFSVKDRIGVAMIEDAEAQGLLSKGGEVIEPTSGNTGIALAFVCAIKQYPLTLTMPDTMSMERRKVLRILGANLVLTAGAQGMRGAIDKAEEIMHADPGRYFMPQQFKNPANPRIHEQTTGPEIWEQTDGRIDALVAGVGTGGTITGVSRFIKNTQGKGLASIAVEPSESPVLSQALAGESLTPGPHKIQGIGAGFVPDILDTSLVDEVIQVGSDEAIRYARLLASEEGVLGGISSGAAILAARRIAERDEYQGKTIVVILPSATERYLSSALFDGISD